MAECWPVRSRRRRGSGRGECLVGSAELVESYLLRFFVGLDLLDCGLSHFFMGILWI